MRNAITVVGLGPGDPSLRTVGTQMALDGAARIILRTSIHPGIKDLADDDRVSSCDDLYESLSNFEAVYEAITDRVIAAAKDECVVFAVPGHPRFGESSVRTLIERANHMGIEITVLAGVSACDSIVTSLGLDPLADEMQIIDAESLEELWDSEPFSSGKLAVAPTRPALITQIYSSRIASHAKLVLARAYPENHQVKLIRAAGVLGEEKVVACELHEIDHQVIDHLTSLYLPPMNELESLRTATSVQRIVARLRAPSGCPWDRKQTHESLRNAILEEAYEVAETIDEGDEYHLSEELGDLFLLIAMQSQIAHESGEFTIEDVYEQVSRKLIRRHPHVFGDVSAETPDQVIATWESVKRAERSANGEEIEQNSFDRLPKSMPILARLTEALPSNGTTEQSMDRNAEALGVTLFDTVRALIASGRDPEQVLIEQSKRYFEAVHSRQD